MYRIVYLLLLSLFSCDPAIPSKYTIEYVVDRATGLCFARYTNWSGHYYLSNVPCTPEVSLLVEDYP